MTSHRINDLVESDSVDLSRRRFLSVSAAVGGGLLIGFTTRPSIGAAEAAQSGASPPFTPNAFVRIGGDGRVVLTMPYVEMGQGTYTSIPMLIAEELEVDLKQVRVEHAPPNEKLYGNPLLGGIQATGNSNAVRASWQPLRQAGATARTMLVSAAAKRWKVDAASCRAQKGEVIHVASGRRLKYGALVADAAKLPLPAPESVTLKRAGDFKLIGTPAKRLDTPLKVNGTAVYGIDARPPGVKIATLAQSPVFGGRVKSVDDAKAKAVKGVRQIVCAVDCGTVVNPDTVKAQIQSAIIFGVTAALHGQITLKGGRVQQSNFHDYRVLRMNEAPAIEVYIVNSTEPPGGMGEAGTSAITPAVTNAIYAATGTRVRKLPVADQAKHA